MFNPRNAIFHINEIREIESQALNRFNLTEEMLMNNAGHAAMNCFLKHWPFAKHVTVICGGGNNGGDGFVFAALAHARGLDIKIALVGEPNPAKSAAFKAYEHCKALNIPIDQFTGVDPLSDVIVDAICGIGCTGALRDETKQVIEQINQSHKPVLALDIPSGLNAENGDSEICVSATATITFIGYKYGLFTGKGITASGEICLDTLQLPAELFQNVKPAAIRASLDDYKKLLQPRSVDWHKGKNGHVLIVGGAEGMSGAARLAGETALRGGAGLVSIATHPAHAAFLNLTRPELMCHGVAKASDLNPLLKRATVVVLGPGLGLSSWAKELQKIVLESALPIVLDADGLNLLSENHNISRENWILTPHPGEAAKLLQQEIAEIQAERFAAVNALQLKYKGVVVLKGARTLIAAEGQATHVCLAGNPSLSTAGTGDVLSGLIAALVAQGFSLHDAANFGVLIHAKAGDIARHEGERGMCALDLLPHIRALLNIKHHHQAES